MAIKRVWNPNSRRITILTTLVYSDWN